MKDEFDLIMSLEGKVITYNGKIIRGGEKWVALLIH